MTRRVLASPEARGLPSPDASVAYVRMSLLMSSKTTISFVITWRSAIPICVGNVAVIITLW